MKMQTSFFSENELKTLGLMSYGKDVLISRFCRLYDPGSISLGNHVRIDDFCILSGRIKIGNHIHISAYTGLYAGDIGIEASDFATISAKCLLYAISDDYSGLGMTNPTVPEEYRHVHSGKVILKKHSIVGAGSILLPGVTLEEGASVGAHSLVTRDIPEWTVCAGTPANVIKPRLKNILELEKQMMEKYPE